MLARNTMTDVWELGGSPADERHENLDFPSWLILLCQPNREEKSKKWLKQCNIFTYLPTFKKSCRRRGSLRYSRDCAVMPGLLFMPQVMTWVDNSAKALAWSRIRGCMRSTGGAPVVLDVAHIQTIMRIEARLNRPAFPVDAKGNAIAAGMRARFIDPAYERLFGEAVIFEVASDNRIGVEVTGLFGGAVKVYVPAVEIEVM